MIKKKTTLTAFILLAGIPIVVIGGYALFREKYYAWISMCAAGLSCLPLCYSFEKKDSNAKELIVLAVLVALSAAGRFVFAWLPGFKPVTAITVIAAMYLGREAGFVVGSLSALISNFYFGQGPWTPFQMFAWGVIGFAAGVFSKYLRKRKMALYIFGAAAGVLFSFLMDIWSTLWADGSFNFSRYLAFLISALPVTAEYAVSNVIFLMVLSRPIGEKLERVRKKYGLFRYTG